MNLLKKIYLRLLKNIEIYGTSNIQFGVGSSLSNSSILNANQGRIILGKNTRVGNSSELVAAKNKTITLKDYTTLYSNCKILGQVTIERYCVLATNIYMSSGNHFAFEYPELLIKKQDLLVRANNPDINQPIHIHEDVWIGNGVFISQGITIGRGAVIGAGTIVTKDVLPYEVIVGNPGKPIKNRLKFNPPSKIQANQPNDLPYFYQGFDHMQDQSDRDKNGIEIIDEAEVILTVTSENISIKGNALSDCVILTKWGESTSNLEIKKGTFSNTISNKSWMKDVSKPVSIHLSVKETYTRIFIESITCN